MRWLTHLDMSLCKPASEVCHGICYSLNSRHHQMTHECCLVSTCQHAICSPSDKIIRMPTLKVEAPNMGVLGSIVPARINNQMVSFYRYCRSQQILRRNEQSLADL